MAINYEWLLEEIIPDGSDDPEIHATYYCESAEELIGSVVRYELDNPGHLYRAALMRETVVGSTFRAWAYIQAGKLPEMFKDGCDADVCSVNAYHEVELRRALKKAKQNVELFKEWEVLFDRCPCLKE